MSPPNRKIPGRRTIPGAAFTLKGTTAREANRLLSRTGEPFWQCESYDHWVRNDVECARIVRYIENNPVKAALTGLAEEFPWSSASEKFKLRLDNQRIHTSVNAARTSARAT